MRPRFFSKPSEFRAWLEKYRDKTRELWVGFHKKGSGRPTITWPQSVDAALVYGWIDGVRRSVDAGRYAIRFTRRKPGSTWSTINVRRLKKLTRLGLVHPAGLKAFHERKKSGVYSYEQRNTARLGITFERHFRANKRAWQFFQTQAPWYRRTATWWVISAKKEETKWKRLAMLIKDSSRGRTIPPLTRPAARQRERRHSMHPATRSRILNRIRKICLSLPETSERPSHGSPAFFVRGKRAFVTYMDNHHGDGRLALWCAAEPEIQRMLVKADAKHYFVPPYVGYLGWVGVRLDRRLSWDKITAVIEDAYLTAAPKRLVAATRR